jgi:hypothetical protein
MPGKRTKNVTNPQAHSAWTERKRYANAENKTAAQFQRMWRRSCLLQREAEGRLTDKNRAELERVGR